MTSGKPTLSRWGVDLAESEKVVEQGILPGMDVLVAVDQVDALLHDSTSWFSFRPQLKRIDPENFRDATAHLRAEITSILEMPWRQRCLTLVDGLDSLASDARTFPIVGGLLLDSNRAYDFLDQLRQDLVTCIREQRAELGRP